VEILLANHYQWQYFNGTSWIDVGTDQASYNTGTLTATTDYRVFVHADESGCDDVYSAIVSVEIVPEISISADPEGGIICSGGNFTLNVTASGSPDIHYQWEYYNGSSWVSTGFDQPSFNTGPLSATTDFRVFVYSNVSGCDDVFSEIATVQVINDLSINTQPVGGSICTGGNFDLSVSATSELPNLHYQWEAFNGVSCQLFG